MGHEGLVGQGFGGGGSPRWHDDSEWWNQFSDSGVHRWWGPSSQWSVVTRVDSYNSEEEKEVRRGSISMERHAGWCSQKTGMMMVLWHKSGEGNRATMIGVGQMEAVVEEEVGNMLLGVTGVALKGEKAKAVLSGSH
jgi:hypothetical protein